MRKKINLIAATFVSTLVLLTSLSAQAGVWEDNSYKTIVVQAIDSIIDPSAGPDLLFRFTGEAGYSLCNIGVNFEAKLVKLESFRNEKTYYMRPILTQFGNSGECKPGEPVATVAKIQLVKSKWFRVKAGQTRTIIMPEWFSIETQSAGK